MSPRLRRVPPGGGPAVEIDVPLDGDGAEETTTNGRAAHPESPSAPAEPVAPNGARSRPTVRNGAIPNGTAPAAPAPVVPPPVAPEGFVRNGTAPVPTASVPPAPAATAPAVPPGTWGSRPLPPPPTANGPAVRPPGWAAAAGRTPPTALDRVTGRLRQAGVSEEEVDRAVQEGTLPGLVYERLLMPSGLRYTLEQAAAQARVPVWLLHRFRRALGFPDVRPDAPLLSELDVRAVVILGQLATGPDGAEEALHLARVLGGALSRLAREELLVRPLASAGPVDSVTLASELVATADTTVPAVAHLLEVVWWRQVQTTVYGRVLRRVHGPIGVGTPWVVGFVDFVGFTQLSQHLGAREQAAVISRWEEVTDNIMNRSVGRFVSMTGDRLMYLTDSPGKGAEVAVALSEAYANDDYLADVRAGLSYGPVIPNGGEPVGNTVELARSIVSIAGPGAVLISDELRRAILEVDQFAFNTRPLRPRVFKDLGRVQLWWCGRTTQGPGEGRLGRSGAPSGPGQPDGGEREGANAERPGHGAEWLAP
jgi:adenylate cyclase